MHSIWQRFALHGIFFRAVGSRVKEEQIDLKLPGCSELIMEYDGVRFESGLAENTMLFGRIGSLQRFLCEDITLLKYPDQLQKWMVHIP